MCRFVETIRLQNHELCNIALHQLRYENTARRFFDSGYALEDIAKVASQFSERGGVNKIRIVYDESGVVFTSCEPYTMKNIKTLRLVECNDIDYTYKYADRSELDKAMTMRGNCDNVVITVTRSLLLYDDGGPDGHGSDALARRRKTRERRYKSGRREKVFPFGNVQRHDRFRGNGASCGKCEL